MKTLVSVFLLAFSLNSFSCPGSEEIKLNDVKTLLAYGLHDSEGDVTYFFEDELRGRDQNSYYISNSRGEKTHKITLQYVRTSDAEYPLIRVNNYRTGEVKLYRGQFGIYRGCNEIKEIQIKW